MCSRRRHHRPDQKQKASIFFTTRAKSPQHDLNGLVIVLGVRLASALASLNSAPRAFTLIMALPKCTSQLLLPFKMHNLLPLTSITPIYRPIQESGASHNASANLPFLSRLYVLHLRGVAYSHQTWECGASPARLASDVTPINLPSGA